MHFRELSIDEYENFQQKHPYRYYLSSSKLIEEKKYNGWNTYYAGVVDESGIILAAAGFSAVPVDRKFHYAYAQRGILCDFEDHDLTAFFTEKLKEYCAEKGIAYIRMDPYVEYQQLDQDGNIVKGGFNHQKMIDDLQALGWKHGGFPRGFDADRQVRYMVVLDLEGKTMADILEDMHPNTRRSIQRTEKMNLSIRKCGPDDLDDFMKLMEFTADKRGFTDLGRKTYQRQMQALGEDGAQVWLCVMKCADVYAKCAADRKKAEKEKEEAEKELAVKPGRKVRTRISEADIRLEQINRQEEETKKLEAQYGPEIILSGAYFVIYDDEMYYISSGSYDALRKYCGPYYIQYQAVQYALSHGCRRYNFTGTSGIFDESADDYGVYLFKKRLGGRPIELLGEFRLVCDEKMMRKIERIDRLKKLIRR